MRTLQFGLKVADRETAVAFYVACGARADARPYIDEVTGLLDRRVVFVIDDHHSASM